MGLKTGLDFLGKKENFFSVVGNRMLIPWLSSQQPNEISVENTRLFFQLAEQYLLHIKQLHKTLKMFQSLEVILRSSLVQNGRKINICDAAFFVFCSFGSFLFSVFEVVFHS
jgi:hypothetical protein